MNYREKIKEGIYFPLIGENASSIEVTDVNFLEKFVILSDESRKSFDSLLKHYSNAELETIKLLEKSNSNKSMMGGLAKEIEIGENIIDPNLATTNFKGVIEVKNTPIPQIDIITKKLHCSSEHDMLRNALNLSIDKETSVNVDTNIKFNFDILKIVEIANIFDINSDVIGDIILEDESNNGVLRDLLKSILEQLKK